METNSHSTINKSQYRYCSCDSNNSCLYSD